MLFCRLNIKVFVRHYHGTDRIFCEKIDYKDIETVFLTCMLHKETMKDTYDLKEILKKYREEAGEISLPEKRAEQKLDIFVNEEGEEELFRWNIPKSRRWYAKKEVWIFKKFGKKIKSGYWGIGMICSQRQKIKLKCEFLERKCGQLFRNLPIM